MTVLLDTHALHWWASDPERLSRTAARAVSEADELAVAAATWFELAWLLRSGRIGTVVPVRVLLTRLAREVRTVSLTPSIAVTAAELPDTFPRDPADRQIYATAIEQGWPLVTNDLRMQAHDREGTVVVW